MFECDVRRTITRYGMIHSGERILVAVSGGPDSTALLDVLCELAPEMKLDLHVAHLDHGWRGRASTRDAEFVRRQAIRRQLPVTVGRIRSSPRAGGAGASDRQSSKEARARSLRRRFLLETARQIGAQRIALGHTRNDQAESLLMRLLRGSGSRGLAGTYPVVDGVLIRPLIEVGRAEVLAHLRRRRLSYRVDATNRDTRMTRNRLRRRLLPLLEREYNPAVVDAIANAADILRDEDACLDDLATTEFRRRSRKTTGGVSIAVDALTEMPPAIRRRVLRCAIADARGDLKRITAGHVRRSLDLLASNRAGKSISLPGGYVVMRRVSALVVVAREPARTRSAGRVGSPVRSALCPVPGEVPLAGFGLRLRASVVPRARLDYDLSSGGRERAFFDADLFSGPLLIRPRRPGDRFVPFGGPGTRKVKSFLIDRKIPVDERGRIPIVLSGERIAWVVGYSIDDRFKVTPATRRVLVLEKESR